MSKKVFVTAVDALLPRMGRKAQIGSYQIALFRLSDGRICALENCCPLTNAPITEGIVSGEYVYEPMRDYKISLLSGEIQEPDEGQLMVYETILEDDQLYVVLP